MTYARMLRDRISLGLPGPEAHQKMRPVGRRSATHVPEESGARKSAVLIAIFDLDGIPAFPVIERPADGSVHSGQISLPGGAHEVGELFPVATALREASEEIGLDPAQVSILGTITPLYIPASNFVVHPVVGSVDGPLHIPGSLVPNPSEVRRVIIVPLTELERCVGEMEFTGSSGEKRVAPCYSLKDVTIWGATAMILSELLEVHRSIQEGETR